jgi:hypothetical protein
VTGDRHLQIEEVEVDRLAAGLRGARRRLRGRKPSEAICWRLEG